MKSLKYILVVSMVIIFGVTPGFAEIPQSLGNIIDKTSADADPKVTVADLISSKNTAMNSYLSSIQSLALGLGKSAEALGVKNQITDKLAIINSLQAGNITDSSLTKARSASDAILDILKQKMQASSGLNAGSQGLLTQGISGLVSNVQDLQSLISEVKNLFTMAQAVLGAASFRDKAKVQGIISTASTLSKNIPLDLKSSQDIFSTLTSFASKLNIAVPQEAVNLLDLLK